MAAIGARLARPASRAVLIRLPNRSKSTEERAAQIAKTKGKNSVFIEKKSGKFQGKGP